MPRGYFGIGIENCKTVENIGSLWRSAHSFGASFIFVIGKRFKCQASDTTHAWQSIPLFKYNDFDQFYENLPHDCRLIGVEFPHDKAKPLQNFYHHNRAIYLLGSEDNGLTKNAISKCHHLVYIPTKFCLNVACAGSIIMYDRMRNFCTEANHASKRH